MEKLSKSMSCPCCSGTSLDLCCGPYIVGEAEPLSAEALMRSRYTAYALGEDAHVLRTWHPRTRPKLLYEPGAPRPSFTGLRVLMLKAGGENDSEGWVEFEASYITLDGAPDRFREVSRFVRVAGKWTYLDGRPDRAFDPAGGKRSPSRNASCPCGSGKKFKRCCAT